MNERARAIWNRLRRPKMLFPSIAVGLMGSFTCGYLILLNPRSVFVRWAQARLLQNVAMITLGPYPEDADFQRFRQEEENSCIANVASTEKSVKREAAKFRVKLSPSC